MDTIWMDLKHSLRGLVARPGFTALVVVPLALGIGLNTAIFSAVYTVLLRSLPYEDPQSLVRVWEARPRMGPNAEQMAAFSLDHFRAWRDVNEVFDGMAALGNVSFNLTGGSEPRRIEGENVSPALFPMLGVEPLHGRYFAEDEEIPGRDRVVLLSYNLWQRVFGADTTLVGRDIRLDGSNYTVVGIMPPEFQFPDPSTEFWVPMTMAPVEPATPGEMRIELLPVIAKLKPGVTVGQAEAAAETFLNNLRGTSEMAQRMNEGVAIHLTSLHEQLVAPVRPALLVLLGAVGFVLLIACANVANLFLVRAQGQERDLAVRAALGAGRGRLMQRLFIESVVYGLSGGAAAVLVAYWGVRMLRLLRPSDLPLLENVGINGTVLGFNLAVALVVSVLVGFVPAIHAGRVDLVSGLKGLGTGLVQATSGRLRSLLAAGEVAVALILFVAAGLMFRSFMTLSSVHPGYEPTDVLTFRVNLPATKYEGGPAQRAFYDRLRESLDAISGVHASGIVNQLPLDQGRLITSLAIEGRPPVEDRMNMPRANMRVTSPGFFQALGIRLVRGRGLEQSDGAGAPPVVVINESLAARYFEDEDPLGKRIQRLGEIVGVMADVRQEGLDAEPEPELYLDYRQIPDRMAGILATMSVAVRVDPRQDGIVQEMRRRIQEIDAELPVADLRPMTERLRDSVARPRLYAVLLALFAGLALILAVSGVYSVISYSVSQRTRETGVRIAFGATSSDIIRLVLAEGWKILFWGLGLGLAVSFGLSRYLQSVLFEVEPFDPLTFVVVAVLLGAAVLLASAVPARQAARIDAMKALRYE
ncbi:MAG: ABC transporter permease [Acidobacteria bacterium]|nr:MAG: ABC transporter permease [Acidobacteriota bacterium]